MFVNLHLKGRSLVRVCLLLWVHVVWSKSNFSLEHFKMEKLETIIAALAQELLMSRRAYTSRGSNSKSLISRLTSHTPRRCRGEEQRRARENERVRDEREIEDEIRWRKRRVEGGERWEMKSKRARDGETGVASQAEKAVSLYKRSPLSD